MGTSVSVDVDTRVTITFKDGSLLVDLPDALLAPEGSLEWIVEIGEGRELEIDFATYQGKKGPFSWKSPTARNPVRGRYTTKGGNDSVVTIPSNRADSFGYWKYDVVLRETRTGNDLATLDPGVLIKKR